MKSNCLAIALFICGTLLCSPYASAQEATQILSVTPPLFQLSVAPGDLWQSSVKIINGNPYELTVYAEVVNFEAEGEEGRGRFMPLLHQDTSTSTLASWIKVTEGPFTIPPEQSFDVPFFVEVPNDASPGGHFAAILIGTKPVDGDDNKLAVFTSQFVTSLFFVRVEGDVNEAGDIREFSVVDSFLDVPEAEFSLRFENKGNVHLQPRGNIIITNMWGKERGVIPINYQTHFGNVLPQSIRDFRFSWKGEKSITEIGRYKASVTLAYGQDGVKSSTATTYFWVIPLKPTLITLASLFGFIAFVTWAIKLYVRRMLALAGVPIEKNSRPSEASQVRSRTEPRIVYKRVSAPLTSGVVDLRGRMEGVSRFFDVFITLGGFIWSYKKFFVSVCIIAVGFVALVLYIADASKDEKEYEITITEEGVNHTVTSDEIEPVAP